MKSAKDAIVPSTPLQDLGHCVELLGEVLNSH